MRLRALIAVLAAILWIAVPAARADTPDLASADPTPAVAVDTTAADPSTADGAASGADSTSATGQASSSASDTGDGTAAPTTDETTPPSTDQTTPPSTDQTTPPSTDQTTPPADETTPPPGDDGSAPADAPSGDQTTGDPVPPPDHATGDPPPPDDSTSEASAPGGQSADEGRAGSSPTTASSDPAAPPESVAGPTSPTVQVQAAEQDAITAQLIHQIQVGCLFICRDTSATQGASVASETSQSVLQDQASAEAALQLQIQQQSATTIQDVQQISIGCLARCYGTTQVDASGLSSDELSVLRVLAALFHAMVGMQSGDSTSTAQAQALTAQAIDQLQSALGGIQVQLAGQSGVTVQVVRQVQWGCLFLCQGTTLVQTAQLVSDTVQQLAQAQDGGGAQLQVAVQTAVTVQAIWQVQIGCLFLCDGTSLTQDAQEISRILQQIGQGQVAGPGFPMLPPSSGAGGGPGGFSPGPGGSGGSTSPSGGTQTTPPARPPVARAVAAGKPSKPRAARHRHRLRGLHKRVGHRSHARHRSHVRGHTSRHKPRKVHGLVA